MLAGDDVVMKKIAGVFLAAGIANASMAAEEKIDSLQFWDTTSYGVILDYFAGELDQYKDKYEGDSMAVFGLRVQGAYDNLQWDMESCFTLLADSGVALRERLHREFSDEKKLLSRHWLQEKNVRAIDLPAIQKSIDKAVDQAVDACAPKLM